MDNMGGGYAVTLNLAPELLLKALDQDNPLDYLSRMVNSRLKRSLGYQIPCYLVLETLCKGRRGVEGRPHLHGALLCSDDELAQVKQALKELHRSASIKFKKCGRPTQLRKIYDGHNWASYSGKALVHTQMVLPDLGGSGFVASNTLRSAAKEIYDADRLALKQRIKKLKLGATR